MTAPIPKASHAINVTLTENTVLALPAYKRPGDVFTYVITQDDTGGWTATLNGTPLNIDLAADAVSVVKVRNDGTGSWGVESVTELVGVNYVGTDLAAGDGVALPLTPAGYLTVLINGAVQYIPYYSMTAE